MKMYFGFIFTIAFLFSTVVSRAAESFSPDNLEGLTYQLTITAGTGPFEKKGTATIAFVKSTYEITGDGVNIASSKGTYTLVKKGNNIKFTFIDANEVKMEYNVTLTYATLSNGTFETSAGGATQSGTFQLKK